MGKYKKIAGTILGIFLISITLTSCRFKGTVEQAPDLRGITLTYYKFIDSPDTIEPSVGHGKNVWAAAFC